MAKAALLLILVVGGMLVVPEPVQAVRRSRIAPSRGRAKQLRAERTPQRVPTYRYPSSTSVNPYYRYGTDYPRYTGAFHARYFQEYGIPSGDRGIRGYAW